MHCSRRDFFSELGRSALRRALPETKARSRGHNRSAPESAKVDMVLWLRPPGAIPEDGFLEGCTRCTDCQTACPFQSIRQLGQEFGAAAGTPAVIPTESPCYVCPDLPCISACKEGALLPVVVRQVRMGRAVLQTSRCYLAMRQPCDYCVDRCPVQNEAIGFGSSGLPVIDEEHCVGCGVCAYLCPAEAISIVPGYA